MISLTNTILFLLTLKLKNDYILIGIGYGQYIANVRKKKIRNGCITGFCSQKIVLIGQKQKTLYFFRSYSFNQN